MQLSILCCRAGDLPRPRAVRSITHAVAALHQENDYENCGPCALNTVDPTLVARGLQIPYVRPSIMPFLTKAHTNGVNIVRRMLVFGEITTLGIA